MEKERIKQVFLDLLRVKKIKTEREVSKTIDFYRNHTVEEIEKSQPNFKKYYEDENNYGKDNENYFTTTSNLLSTQYNYFYNNVVNLMTSKETHDQSAWKEKKKKIDSLKDNEIEDFIKKEVENEIKKMEERFTELTFYIGHDEGNNNYENIVDGYEIMYRLQKEDELNKVGNIKYALKKLTEFEKVIYYPESPYPYKFKKPESDIISEEDKISKFFENFPGKFYEVCAPVLAFVGGALSYNLAIQNCSPAIIASIAAITSAPLIGGITAGSWTLGHAKKDVKENQETISNLLSALEELTHENPEFIEVYQKISDKINEYKTSSRKGKGA